MHAFTFNALFILILEIYEYGHACVCAKRLLNHKSRYMHAQEGLISVTHDKYISVLEPFRPRLRLNTQYTRIPYSFDR